VYDEVNRFEPADRLREADGISGIGHEVAGTDLFGRRAQRAGTPC
jgi:hypothetical protein